MSLPSREEATTASPRLPRRVRGDRGRENILHRLPGYVTHDALQQSQDAAIRQYVADRDGAQLWSLRRVSARTDVHPILLFAQHEAERRWFNGLVNLLRFWDTFLYDDQDIPADAEPSLRTDRFAINHQILRVVLEHMLTHRPSTIALDRSYHYRVLAALSDNTEDVHPALWVPSVHNTRV